MKNSKYQGLVFCVVVIMLMGCSGGTEGMPEINATQTLKNDIIRVAGQDIILTGLHDFQDASISLNIMANTFLSSPTSETLSQIQSAWASAQNAWQATASYQFGPVEDERISNQINFWPKRPATIDAVLSGSETLSTENVAAFGATKKGLPVLEYVLFDHVNGDAVVLSSFQSSDRKKAYLLGLTADLVTNAESLTHAWSVSGNNYVASFLSSTNALNMMLNQMVFVLEDIKNTKVGTPLGVSSRGATQPDSVESQQSQRSLSHIKQSLDSLDTLFTGRVDNRDAAGMDDYLDHLGFTTLKERINAQLDLVETQIDGFSLPLWQAVDTASDDVTLLYTELTTLLRLVKVDMATAINETVHFNDSDGD